MSRSSPALQSTGFTPLRATIVPIDSEGLSVFGSERDTETTPATRVDQLVRVDQPVGVEPSARADQTGRTGQPAKTDHADLIERPPSAPKKAAMLLWLGIITPAMAVGAMIGLALTSLGATPAAPPPTMGAVTITSEPSGAPVTVDGVARGSTPVAMVIAAGAHRLEVGTGSEVPPRLLQVSPGGDTSMHVQWRATPAPAATTPKASERIDKDKPHAAAIDAERPARTERAKAAVGITSTFRPVPTGWLTVTSAFPVQVLDNGSEIGTSASTRLTLPAGDHSLTFVNDALEFRESRMVTIAAAKKAAITIDTPRGMLNVNARPWAEVWVDGRRVGETPIGNLSLPIGEHEVTFRHPNRGEQRKTVTVGARSAARVAVEFQP
jgi:PEGA domain